MPAHVYQVIEIVGSSSIGTDDAIRNAIEKASQTHQHLNWFQVLETRGHIADGKVAHFQVVLKVGYRLED
jgi:flavin-binding protein dodecin